MGQNDRAITLLEKAWAFLEAAGDPGFDLMRTRSNMPRNLAP